MGPDFTFRNSSIRIPVSLAEGGTSPLGTAGTRLRVNAGATSAEWAFRQTRNVTSADTLLVSDEIVTANAISGAFALAVPSAGSNPGLEFTIRKTDLTLNAVTITSVTSLNTFGESVRIVSNGTNWSIVERVIPGFVTQYTPTLNSNTSVAANGARWWRVGQYIFVEGAVRYNGVGNNSTFTVSLPSGPTIDTTLQFDAGDVPSQIAGFWGWFDNAGSAASRGGYVQVASGSTTTFSFRRSDDSNNANSNSFNTDDRITYQIRVPISGWNT